MPDQIAPEESRGERGTPPPFWRELCGVAVYILTVVLVFAGLTVVCNLAWPHERRAALFASLILLLGWMVLADWLKVFAVRRPIFSGRPYASALQFLFYFVFFSAAVMLLDKWQGHSVEILGTCISGLLYAIGMAWIVPQLPWHREDPFATKSSFHRSE